MMTSTWLRLFLGGEPLWTLAFAAEAALALVFSAVIIARKREPAVTLAWILAFVFLPYIGFLLYLLFGYSRFRRRRRRKPSPSRRAAGSGGRRAGLSAAAAVDPEFSVVESLATRITEFPVVGGNRLDFYEDESNRTDEAIWEAIRGARHHVHMEYYIFKPDDVGLRYRELLIEKARQGVRCRLLIDSVGSWKIGGKFIAPMREAGVKVEFFWPVSIFRRPWGFHLRNHRKLTVVDGKTGFIGSQNIANELLPWKARHVAWRETDVRVQGPIVDQLQTIFIEDWAFTCGEDLEREGGDAYFPPREAAGDCRAQTLPTGPDGTENALQLVFLAAVHTAKRRITVTTPYFIPSQSMALALEGAARRGVRVDLLLPRVSDHPIIIMAGRSSYRELLESGVNIYEHPRTFVHAKVVTVDDRLAIVGSANMDVRSFLINFEASLLIYDRDAVRLQESFDRMIASAEKVDVLAVRAQSFGDNLLQGACRLLSSLL